MDLSLGGSTQTCANMSGRLAAEKKLLNGKAQSTEWEGMSNQQLKLVQWKVNLAEIRWSGNPSKT